MKTLASFLFCVLSFGSFSQSVMNLDNCSWVNNHTQYDNSQTRIISSIYTAYCTTSKDTVISSKTYRVLFYCNNHTYKGALRSDTGHVYFVPKDSLQEKLLYDFTLNVGDSISDFYMENPPFIDTAVIDLIDTLIINGESHRRLHIDYGSGWGGGEWIEGIGCSMGILQECFINISGYGRYLTCFSRNDTTLYPQYQPGQCKLNISVKEIPTSPAFSFYPNPVKDKLWFSFSEKPTGVKLYNSQGRLVLSLSAKENLGYLNMEQLPAGIYFLVNEGENQPKAYRIVKGG